MSLIKTCLSRIVGWTVLATAGNVSAEVTFSGLDGAQEANARVVMPLASTECTSPRWRVERLFRDADKDLHSALEALGYYDVDISKSLSFDDACWRASFNLTVGEPVVLGSVGVEIVGAAAADTEFVSLIEANKPTAGTILNHGRYEAYKTTLLSTAIARGYFDAEFLRSEVTVTPEKYSADVQLALTSGSRYRFGEINYTEGILRSNLMRGFSDIRSGDFYQSKAISDLYEVLNGSTYFGAVSIRTDPLDREQKTVPVNVVLQPGTRRIYSIGAGFTTDTGPNGRLGYANRRRNDKGHQFESKLFASSVRSELTASYRWPRRDPRKEWFNTVLGVQHEDTDTSESDTFKIGIQRSRSVGESWLETRYLDYTYEDFAVGDQDTTTELVILGINWESARGREVSRVTNGWRLSFDLQGASDNLGSDTSFGQFNFTTKWIHSFSEKTRVIARGSAGVTAKEGLSELPVSVRFFAGGDRSVRGYDYKTLGPVDQDGLVIGGSNLLEGSLEIDYLLRPRWAVAAFVDSGSAFNNSDVDFSTGAGLGLRWYSPVGPIRLDLAHPLDDPDQDVRVHISLGLDL
ncbi:MAG: autotransporter assembly complex protein TamA [Woeseiaceae bacterium]